MGVLNDQLKSNTVSPRHSLLASSLLYTKSFSNKAKMLVLEVGLFSCCIMPDRPL